MTPDPQKNRLVLASASPRRRELLTQLGVPFDVVPANVDETPHAGERPLDLVRRLAVAKARSGERAPALGADTIVDCDGEVFGQPIDADDAVRMLRRLSGRTHRVHTGVALRTVDAEEVVTVTTLVTMAPITPGALQWYLGTGEPFDKAGAYAIQGAGAVLVEGVRGSVSNVVGLPLTTVADVLGRHGIWRPDRRPD